MISNTTHSSAHEVVSLQKWLSAATLGAAHWLSLAAAPTFAIMAVLTGAGGAPDILCAAAHDASPLGGMAPMYWLMSAFHLAPWLRLISGRRSGAPVLIRHDATLDQLQPFQARVPVLADNDVIAHRNAKRLRNFKLKRVWPTAPTAAKSHFDFGTKLQRWVQR